MFGTPRVSVFSLASTNSTAENQRLKLSTLIWGLSAVDNRCHNCPHFLSIPKLVNSVTQLPHWLTPRAIVRKTPPETGLTSSVFRRRNPGKKSEKRVNTRENRDLNASMPLWGQLAAHAQSFVWWGNV